MDSGGLSPGGIQQTPADSGRLTGQSGLDIQIWPMSQKLSPPESAGVCGGVYSPRPYPTFLLYMCLGTKTKATSIFCISPILLVFIGTCPTSLSVFPRKSNSSSTTESTFFWTVSQVTNVLYWMSKNSMGLYVTSPLSTSRAVRGVLRLKGSLDN